MARENSITFEQVTAAAENIKSEGGKPTSRAVRERLGSGSMGTINKMLQDWKAGQERKIETALVLPVGLQRALLDFMDAELTNARAQLRNELAEQQQEATDLATENERQAVKIEDLEEAIEERINDCNMKDGQIAQLYKMYDELRNDVARERQSAEIARTELAKKMLLLEVMPRLEAKLTEMKKKLEIEHSARVKAEKEAAVAEAQKIGIEEMLEEVKAVAIREKGELVKAVEAARSEIIELKKPVKREQPRKKVAAKRREGGAGGPGEAGELQGGAQA